MISYTVADPGFLREGQPKDQIFQSIIRPIFFENYMKKKMGVNVGGGPKLVFVDPPLL